MLRRSSSELATLINLPAGERNRTAAERLDQVRWALTDIDPAGRMAAYAAAVAAIDTDHLAGPHPDPARPLTPEAYAFETWRVCRIERRSTQLT